MVTPNSDKHPDLQVFLYTLEAGNTFDEVLDLVITVRISDTVLSCI